MPSPLHGTTIDHVELMVPDRHAAAAWYQDVLGLTPVATMKHWSRDPRGPLMISGDGGRVCLALFQSSPTGLTPKGAFRRVAFRVSGAEFLAFLEYGRSLELNPMKVQDHDTTISVYFQDPCGHALEVTTYEHEMVRANPGIANLTTAGGERMERSKAKTPPLDWRGGEGESTRIGYVSVNDQRCAGTLCVAGTDHMQYAYKLECLKCGHVYGANGSDIHLRKCPECQDGRPGITYWLKK